MIDVLLSKIKNYAISLPERKQSIVEEFRNNSIPLEIIDGIDKRGRPVPSNWSVRDSDYGCALSFIRALDHAYSKGDEFFSIMEDDFVFRMDTMSLAPEIEEVSNLDFDVIYMTGHYAKGILKIEPRRMRHSDKLVRAVGIFTNPARIFRRDYAPILIDHISKNMRDHGFGADGTDALLQRERQRTYAFEAHIGGQRVKDARSWEPRVFDWDIIGASRHIVDHYPGGKEVEDYNTARAISALMSRRRRVAAFDASMRSMALIAEGCLRGGGGVTSFLSREVYNSYSEHKSDRLRRYEGYDVLDHTVYERNSADIDFKEFDTLFFDIAADFDASHAAEIVSVVSEDSTSRLVVFHGDHLELEKILKAARNRVHKSYDNITFFST